MLSALQELNNETEGKFLPNGFNKRYPEISVVIIAQEAIKVVDFLNDLVMR